MAYLYRILGSRPFAAQPLLYQTPRYVLQVNEMLWLYLRDLFAAITQAAIKRQFTEEDADALKAGTAIVLHDKFSASGMIIAGIELEELQ